MPEAGDGVLTFLPDVLADRVRYAGGPPGGARHEPGGCGVAAPGSGDRGVPWAAVASGTRRPRRARSFLSAAAALVGDRVPDWRRRWQQQGGGGRRPHRGPLGRTGPGGTSPPAGWRAAGEPAAAPLRHVAGSPPTPSRSPESLWGLTPLVARVWPSGLTATTSGSLLIRDVEVQATACRDRSHQGLQLQVIFRLRTRRWRMITSASTSQPKAAAGDPSGCSASSSVAVHRCTKEPPLRADLADGEQADRLARADPLGQVRRWPHRRHRRPVQLCQVRRQLARICSGTVARSNESSTVIPAAARHMPPSPTADRPTAVILSAPR